MNGPALVSFVTKHVIPEIKKISKDVDKIYIHQAGKIVTKIIRSSMTNQKLIPTNYSKYGNLVSTSIPLLLQENIKSFSKDRKIVLCGFGVGLSMALVKLAK